MPCQVEVKVVRLEKERHELSLQIGSLKKDYSKRQLLLEKAQKKEEKERKVKDIKATKKEQVTSVKEGMAAMDMKGRTTYLEKEIAQLEEENHCLMTQLESLDATCVLLANKLNQAEARMNALEKQNDDLWSNQKQQEIKPSVEEEQPMLNQHPIQHGPDSAAGYMNAALAEVQKAPLEADYKNVEGSQSCAVQQRHIRPRLSLVPSGAPGSLAKAHDYVNLLPEECADVIHTDPSMCIDDPAKTHDYVNLPPEECAYIPKVAPKVAKIPVQKAPLEADHKNVEGSQSCAVQQGHTRPCLSLFPSGIPGSLAKAHDYVNLPPEECANVIHTDPSMPIDDPALCTKTHDYVNLPPEECVYIPQVVPVPKVAEMPVQKAPLEADHQNVEGSQSGAVQQRHARLRLSLAPSGVPGSLAKAHDYVNLPPEECANVIHTDPSMCIDDPALCAKTHDYVNLPPEECVYIPRVVPVPKVTKIPLATPRSDKRQQHAASMDTDIVAYGRKSSSDCTTLPEGQLNTEGGEHYISNRIDMEIQDEATQVSAQDARRNTLKHVPFDPFLKCLYCNRMFRYGEIQKYKKHVLSCTES